MPRKSISKTSKFSFCEPRDCVALRLFTIARNFFRDRDDQEELILETLLEAYQSWPGFHHKDDENIGNPRDDV